MNVDVCHALATLGALHCSGHRCRLEAPPDTSFHAAVKVWLCPRKCRLFPEKHGMNGFGACRPSHDLCKPPVAHVIRETSYVKVGKVGGGRCDRVRRPRAKSFEGVWIRKWTLKPAGRKVCRRRGEAGEIQNEQLQVAQQPFVPSSFCTATQSGAASSVYG